MSSSCKGMRKALVNCIKETQCFKMDEFGFHRCLKEEYKYSIENDTENGKCIQEWRGYALCRVSQVKKSFFIFSFVALNSIHFFFL